MSSMYCRTCNFQAKTEEDFLHHFADHHQRIKVSEWQHWYNIIQYLVTGPRALPRYWVVSYALPGYRGRPDNKVQVYFCCLHPFDNVVSLG